MRASKAGDEDLHAEGACEAWREGWSGEGGEMAHQGDAVALADLGEQLYNASEDGEAAEAARLLELNAPVNHRPWESISEHRSW